MQPNDRQDETIAPSPPDRPKILFIVGVQRSGTTLLRTMLHAHPGICVGYECGFYRRLSDRHGGTIDLARDLDRFLDDLFALRRFEHWGLSRDQVAGALTSDGQSALAYNEAIYRIGILLRDTQKPDADWIGYKNPNGIYHLDFIFRLFPDARVLHVIRDPRAILASEKAKGLKRGRYNSGEMIWMVARRYRNMVRERAKWRHDPRYIEILYEDLVGGFPDSIELLLAALGLGADPGVTNYHRLARDGDFTPESELWQHSRTLTPPDKARLTAFRDELDEGELIAIETRCRGELREIYGVDVKRGWIDGAVQTLRWAGSRLRNRR